MEIIKLFLSSVLLIIYSVILNGDNDHKTTKCMKHNYTLKFNDSRAELFCGTRHVLVIKSSYEEIAFIINKYFDYCCFRYIYRSNESNSEDNTILFSRCKEFNNNSKHNLEHDFIEIRCGDTASIIDYVDYYAYVKKSTNNADHVMGTSWNVLMLGMDSMSRRRAYKSIPDTVQYMKDNDWLDFSEYSAVGDNTISNLMPILSGRAINWPDRIGGHVHDKCFQDMSNCNHQLIWHQFKESGYITAFGEDSTHSTGSIFRFGNGFSEQPTDHYIRPFFLASERPEKHKSCSGRVPSAQQVLTYALSFVKSYRDTNFFGFFWINSISSNFNQSPVLFDQRLVKFLSALEYLGGLKNTMIIFFSNHGVRFGNIKYSPKAFYDTRLPMLFMWVPKSFRKLYPNEYANIKLNQNRLTTPYDLHLTLWDILLMGNHRPITVQVPRGCPNCKSLFEVMLPERTCIDANIDDKYCPCYELHSPTTDSYEAEYSLLKAASFIYNLSSTIPTKPCTECQLMTLEKLLRINYYYDEKKQFKYYVIAFVVKPKIVFEVTVRKYLQSKGVYYYKVVAWEAISRTENLGDCTVYLEHSQSCYCQTIENQNCMFKTVKQIDEDE